MITVEGTLDEIVSVLPQLEINGKTNTINYNFGSTEELLNFLKQKRAEQKTPYPLVWIETPIDAVEVGKFLTVTNLPIIIATLSKSTLSNKQRLDTTFNQVLFVVKDNLMKALRSSGKTEVMSIEIQRTLYFNYENAEHTATDV